MTKPIVVSTFYHFAPFSDYQEWQPKLKELCDAWQLRGTILLAAEGINATIAGSREGIDRVVNFIKSDDRFKTMETKEGKTDIIPFGRMKVRLKKEIIKLGIPSLDPLAQGGEYVDAQAWNDLISDPEVVLIDTRNEYEVEMGTFKGAIDPHLDSFGEFPQYVETHLKPNPPKKVAMFCTGGIRCEKASAYLKQQGFSEVYQLKGGILKYLEVVPPQKSLWRGKCFVFDERVAVDHSDFQ
ncbi:MAG: rhodanese-related sulfurtransferase [Pseudanabaenaceae cyanobacterium SKYGB_i_bin29]|nr:rhodanese-related sulfurtransferase [Pseudanabaenaceae cyanobacterium SKYG29]MDW8420322.1 rhodanese-related sulfurtransferase [Pseudanabaenaceae cyanobacterium SKYGB_i_bin29]